MYCRSAVQATARRSLIILYGGKQQCFSQTICGGKERRKCCNPEHVALRHVQKLGLCRGDYTSDHVGIASLQGNLSQLVKSSPDRFHGLTVYQAVEPYREVVNGKNVGSWPTPIGCHRKIATLSAASPLHDRNYS